ASPISGSVFQAGGDEFRPAARRLAGLHRVFLPTASLAVGTALIAAGLWRFFSARNLHFPPINIKDPTATIPDVVYMPTQGAWVLLGLAIAAIGFVFARLAATMARQTVWANLRAGAGYAVGSALLGLALAVCYFADELIPPPVFTKYLQFAVPIFLVVMGIECFLNFVLGVYRPRKAGEHPRPAFDSGLLSFVSAPDRIAESISDAINYQLGFNVTSGWFYRLLSRAALPLLAAGFLIIWGLTAVGVVKPHQQAIVLRMGAPVRVEDPGLFFKWPWPIETISIPEYFGKSDNGRPKVQDLTVTGVRNLTLGTSPPASNDAVLWTNDHAGVEVFQFVRTDGSATRTDGELADVAMVSVEIPMQYVIDDVLLFDTIAAPTRRDDLITAIAKREISRYCQELSLDDLLGANRVVVSVNIGKRIQAALDKLNPGPDGKPRGSGVRVIFAGIAGVHPPKDAAKSFETAVQADQRKEANIDAAKADAVKTLTTVVGDVSVARSIVQELDALETLTADRKVEAAKVAEQEFKIRGLIESARGSAASLLSKAAADRWERHMGDRGRAARYEGQLALYNAAPMLYRTNLYFAALKGAMKGSRVYVTSDEVPDLRIDFDLQDKNLGVDVFEPNKD
ncbi:MAG: SPFH domain-containing protein, partial [bacterium]|nr:SPFH domain-containing protein [bacterium]